MITPKWKRRAKRLGISLIVLLLLYAALGFWAVPALVRYVGLAKLNEQVAGHGKVEDIRFNPFTWTLELDNFRAYTPDETEVMHFDLFRVNLQPTSLASDTMVVREVFLDGYSLDLIIDEEGRPNIASALTRLQEGVTGMQEEAERARPESDEPFVIPHVRIDAFHVVNASLRVEIHSLSRPFAREFTDLSFTMDDVHTVADYDNPYEFSLATGRGERIDVTGHLRLDPLSSLGALRIERLQLPDFQAFAGDQFGFEMGGGVLNFSINYAFSPLGDSPRLDLTEGRLRLTDFSLLEKGRTEPFQTISRLELKGLGVDALRDRITLESFQLEGALLRVVRGSDGVLNLIRYIAPPEQQARIASEARQEAAAEQIEREIRLGVVSADQDIGVALTSAWRQIQELIELNWDLAAREVNIQGVDLIWRDEFLTEPAELRWTGIKMSARRLTNGATPFPFDLSLTMNETGHVGLHGTFTAEPASTQFDLALNDLPLGAIAPYVNPLAPVQLQSGALSASGQSAIAFPDEGLPELSATIDGSLAGFDLQWDNGDPLLAWQNLEVGGVNATTKPMSLLANEIKLTAPVAHLERQADGAPRLPIPEAKKSEPSPAEKTTPPPAPPTGEGATPAVTLQVDELIVDQGEVRVKDLAVSPAVEFTLEKIQFQAAPLAYPDIQPMTFALEYAFAQGPAGSIQVEGALDPMRPLAATEFTVSTRGVTLAPFAPYAVPVIGRPPTDGHLTANLGYSITNGEIDGKNQMQIKTVRFGERPPDTNAPELPLELGVAILEDSDGLMHIDIPVAGNTKDPEFGLERMISYAISNVLEKLATAPFAAIGALGELLPGNEETGKFIPFEPGSAEVAMDMLPVLEKMAAEVSTRPALITTLTPSIDLKADKDGLRDQRFDAMLKAKMKEIGGDQAAATASLYQALSGVAPTPPAQPAPAGDTLPADGETSSVEAAPPAEGEASLAEAAPPAEDQATTAAAGVSLEAQQRAIRESIEITEEDLAALAQSRAAAVREELVRYGLNPANVAVTSESAYETQGSRVLLGAEAAEAKLTQEVSLAPDEKS